MIYLVLILMSTFSANAVPNLPSNRVNCIFASPTSSRIFFCTSKGLAISNDNGNTIASVIDMKNGLSVSEIENVVVYGEKIFVLLGDGKIFKSHDGVFFGPAGSTDFPDRMKSIDSKGYQWTLTSDRGRFRFALPDGQNPIDLRFPSESLPCRGDCKGEFTSIGVSMNDRVWFGHSLYGAFYSDDKTNSFREISGPSDPTRPAPNPYKKWVCSFEFTYQYRQRAVLLNHDLSHSVDGIPSELRCENFSEDTKSFPILISLINNFYSIDGCWKKRCSGRGGCSLTECDGDLAFQISGRGTDLRVDNPFQLFGTDLGNGTWGAVKIQGRDATFYADDTPPGTLGLSFRGVQSLKMRSQR